MSTRMKIVITGASGQLGSEFQRYFEEKNVDVSAYSSAELDITDIEELEQVITSVRPDYLINCAAYTAVDKAEEEIERCNAINSHALKFIGNTCHDNEVSVLHFSTDYVFDGASEKSYEERDQTAPINIYGLTKRDGERALIESECNSLTLRVSWLYSEFGTNFPRTIDRLLSEKDELNIVDDQISSPTWTKPLVEFIGEKLLPHKELFTGELYHYSENGEASWYDIATRINEKHHKHINAVGSAAFLSAAKRPSYSKLNSNLAKEKLDLSVLNWHDYLEQFLKIIQ